MTTLMVYLRLGRSNETIIRLASELAAKWRATVIGIAVYRRPIMPGRDLDVTGINVDERELQGELYESKREFHEALERSGIDMEWRSAVTSGSIADYLIEQSRAIDLFIGTIEKSDDTARQANIEDVVRGIGRPALLVPSSIGEMDLGNVLIGWTDSRQARRATLDALPLLKQAWQVSVCEVATKHDLTSADLNVRDVAGWLNRNAIPAGPLAMPLHDDIASDLLMAADDRGAGVIVVGAYGHSKLCERVLGGVTAALLRHSQKCLFLSH